MCIAIINESALFTNFWRKDSIKALKKIKEQNIESKFKYKLENGAIIESNKTLKEIENIYKQKATLLCSM